MNRGYFATEFGNFSLLTSVPNLKRIRLEQVSIPSFAFTNMKFENLQKLSLFTCNIGQAFSTSTIQVSEALPKLEEINIDYSNDLIELPAEIFYLIKLKKISITNCHKLIALPRPREIGKLVNLEILRLSSCIKLLELPYTIGGLHKLRILDISECLETER
jgi:Leucine-rich repeat (LRR) protein